MEDSTDGGPMVEMSQDCIEWDESNNVDLRQIGRSPLFGHLHATPKAAGRSSLQGIKRRIEESPPDSATSLRTQPSSDPQKQRPSSEQEIDGIFNILEEEDTSGTTSTRAPSASSASTQRHGNRATNSTAATMRQPVFKSTTTLATRHRRRRREVESLPSPSKRPHTMTMHSPKVAPATQSSSSELQDLLQQMSTPQSARASRVPLATIAETPEQVRHRQNIEANASTRSVDKIPPRRLDSSKVTLQPSFQQPKPQLTRTLPAAQQQQMNTRTPPAVATQQLPPRTQRIPRVSLEPPPPRPPPKTARIIIYPDKPLSSDDATNVPKPKSAVASQIMPPLLEKAAATKPADDDEFGFLDFGDDDLVNLDSLLSIRSSQRPVTVTVATQNNKPVQRQLPTMNDATHMAPPSVPSSPRPNPQPLAPRTNIMPSGATAIAILQKAVVPPPAPRIIIPEKQQMAEDDEFGDFPEVDFDAIDQVIAQHHTQPEGPNMQAPTTKQPLPMIVKNPKISSPDSELAFLTFSRYKVLAVDNNTDTYTKTLSVASWTLAMLQEQEKDRNIHKNVSESRSSKPNPVSEQSNDGRQPNLDFIMAGCLHLRGEWYHTRVDPGDELHVCSLTGRYRTDAQALPLILHSAPPLGSDIDDLVLIMHPDLLMTPTNVSEAVGCSRRAVLKARIGSTGLSSKAALVGTMRHELFGVCLQEKDFSHLTAKANVQKIVRRNAEGLLGCGVTVAEAEHDVLAMLPTIKEFVDQYTAIGREEEEIPPHPSAIVQGHGHQSDIKFVANSVQAIEETVVSPELALKGNIDAIVHATSVTLNDKVPSQTQSHNVGRVQDSVMCVELKTGHNQNSQNAHMAQLALYTLMLQVRHGTALNPHRNQNMLSPLLGDFSHDMGASTGGILLYLNDKSVRTVHVAPLLNEIKSLIGQRNVVASELARASRPRGVVLSYDKEKPEDEYRNESVSLLPASAALLPEVLPNSHSCKRCYSNKECMMYVTAELSSPQHTNANEVVQHSHGELLQQYTGHLTQEEITYFRDWDRLIDLEADATTHSTATAWLQDSTQREKESGESVSSLVFDGAEPSPDGGAPYILIGFRRSLESTIQTPLSNLGLSPGSYLIISTDATSFHASASSDASGRNPGSILSSKRRFRHQMHIVRGTIDKIEADRLLVRASRDDLERIRGLALRYKETDETSDGHRRTDLLFRIDKDRFSSGMTTLRQNLINFMTGGTALEGSKEPTEEQTRLQQRLSWLRDVIVRLRSPVFIEYCPSIFTTSTSTPQLPGCDLESLAFEYAELNPDQRAAVEKVFCARDYTLLQGLPGTGKTCTLAFVARLLAAHGRRVLITSYTHAAVDNVVLKLMESGLASTHKATGLPPLVRVGQRSSCHLDVRPVMVSELARNLDRKTTANAESREDKNFANGGTVDDSELPSASSLRTVVSSASIVCISALSVPRSPLLAGETFDVVIVDEAGQIGQPAILGALMAADSFVLVGDHLQLPPLVNSEIAELGGYGVSMLKRLAEQFPYSIAQLTYQYRSNEDICRISSEAVYGGKLKCGNEAVRRRRLYLPDFPKSLPRAVSKKVYHWLLGTINPNKSVVFVDTDNIKKSPESKPRPPSDPVLPKKEGIDPLEGTVGGRSGGSVVNETEAALVRYIVSGLIATGLTPSSIGVVCPFRAQLRILEENPTIAQMKNDGLELSTIDRYQGRDKEAIILSFVRSNPRGKAGRLLQDIRRLNVALTRAKCKLIMIGSFSTLSLGSDALKPILEQIDARSQRLLLPENAVQCYDIP